MENQYNSDRRLFLTDKRHIFSVHLPLFRNLLLYSKQEKGSKHSVKNVQNLLIQFITPELKPAPVLTPAKPSLPSRLL